MTLLEEIQTATVDSKSDLGTILRKCKLLAARLDNKPFQDWLTWESNGYPNDILVPDYRVWSLEVKGHFTGYGGSGLQNVPIPMATIPEKTRKFYQRWQCRESVAAIEATLAKSKSGGGTLHVGTGDLALILGTKVYQEMNCLQAWAEFGEGHLVEVLNSVRNRILDFTLAIQKEAPDIGEKGKASSGVITTEKMTQIFNTTIYGGTANLLGTAKDSTVTFNIGTRDFNSLQEVLEENGVQKTDLLELKDALESENVKNPSEGFGPKVSAWIAKMMRKAADGSWKIGLGVAGTLLARAIAKYYGIGD